MKTAFLASSLVCLILIIHSCTHSDNNQSSNSSNLRVAAKQFSIYGFAHIMESPVPDPEDASATEAKDAKDSVTKFKNSVSIANRLAISYTLPKNLFQNAPDGTAPTAIRIYNCLENPTPASKYFVIASLYNISPSVQDIIPSAPLKWMQSNYMHNYDADYLMESKGVAPPANAITAAPGGKTVQDLRRGAKEFYRQSNPSLGTSALDPYESFVVTKDEYDKLVPGSGNAVSIRVYRGKNEKNQSVIVVVGVNGTGLSIWQSGFVIVAGERHLCPTACDLY